MEITCLLAVMLLQYLVLPCVKNPSLKPKNARRRMKEKNALELRAGRFK